MKKDQFWWLEEEWMSGLDRENSTRLACSCSHTSREFDEQELEFRVDEGSCGVREAPFYAYSCKECGMVQIFNKKLRSCEEDY